MNIIETMLIAGLTGNYGMGKSSVLALFRELGAEVIESDRVVDTLLRERDVMGKVCGMLGGDVVNSSGGLDKKKIAARIFADAGLKARMEQLLHPLVLRKIDDFIGGLPEKTRIVVVEIPLLFECGYGDRYHRTITVFTPEETALHRLMAAGVSRPDAQSRMANQLSIETKRGLADFNIDNSGTREETGRQVEEIYRKLIEEEKTIGQ